MFSKRSNKDGDLWTPSLFKKISALACSFCLLARHLQFRPDGLQVDRRTYFDFFSSWTSNFGVVPLFLSIVFLFFPAFVLFLALILSVCAVLDAISILLVTIISSYWVPSSASSRPCNLLSTWSLVKAWKRTARRASCFLLLLCPLLHAEEGQSQHYSVPDHPIIMAIGEHHELNLPGLVRFSIGNPELISHKYEQAKNSLVIKARKMGFLEILVWMKHGKKISYPIYILSKREQLKLQSLAQALQNVQVEYRIDGPLVSIDGEIKSLKAYFLIREFEKKYPNDLNIKASLSKELKSKILGGIYKELFKYFLGEIKCEINFSHPICQLPVANTLPPEILNTLKKNYYVDFLLRSPPENYENFLVRIKILQIESSNQNLLDLGLERLDFKIGDLFTSNWKNILKNENLALAGKDISFSLLAEPEFVLTMEKKISIKLGGERAFANGNNDKIIAPQLSWKFIGLQMDFVLSKQNAEEDKQYYLTYHFKYSTATGEGQALQGNQERSTAFIKNATPLQLFKINFDSQSKEVSSASPLQKIPLLGFFFKNKLNSKMHKTILGYIEIKQKGIIR